MYITHSHTSIFPYTPRHQSNHTNQTHSEIPGMLWANPKETTGFLRMLCDLGTHGNHHSSFKTSLPQNSSKILASNPWMVTRPWHKSCYVARCQYCHVPGATAATMASCCYLSSCCIRKSTQQQARKDCGFLSFSTV